MLVIEIEANRCVAIASDRKRLPRPAHRLGFVLVASIVSAPVGCSLRDPSPAETDPSTGSSPSTGNDDNGGPVDTGPGNTSVTGPSTTSDTGPGSTGTTGASTTSDTGPGSTGSTGASTTSDTAASTTTGPSSTSDTEASTTTGSTGASTTSDTAASTDDTGESCDLNDTWEPNNVSGAAAVIPNYPPVDAFLCPAESDWYLYEVGPLKYDDIEMQLRLIVEGSALCCDDPLPNAPENTVTVEIYSADTLVLLADETSPIGAIDMERSGEVYGHDLLLHIFGPTPAATYGYTFNIDVYHDEDGEDECEC